MKVKMKTKSYLNYTHILGNGVYICTYSPTGLYDNWVLIGVNHNDLFGIWAGKDSSIFCTGTFDYEQFKFQQIEAELVEI